MDKLKGTKKDKQVTFTIDCSVSITSTAVSVKAIAEFSENDVQISDNINDSCRLPPNVRQTRRHRGEVWDIGW